MSAPPRLDLSGCYHRAGRGCQLPHESSTVLHLNSASTMTVQLTPLVVTHVRSVHTYKQSYSAPAARPRTFLHTYMYSMGGEHMTGRPGHGCLAQRMRVRIGAVSTPRDLPLPSRLHTSPRGVCRRRASRRVRRLVSLVSCCEDWQKRWLPSPRLESPRSNIVLISAQFILFRKTDQKS